MIKENRVGKNKIRLEYFKIKESIEASTK